MKGKAIACFAGALALLAAMMGCASKNYVRNQVAPLVDQTNQLDEKSASNTRQIRDTDERAQSGVHRAQDSADRANQQSLDAQKNADSAGLAASNAVHRADSLESVVKGLDNYRSVTGVTVTFAFDKAVLSKEEQRRLDDFAAQLIGARNYILEVTGGTDSVGSAEYNYDLSQRRADAVVLYLSSKYGVEPHRFYLIGIGKDKEVATNKTAEGRKRNRRVEVRMLTNREAAPNAGSTLPAGS